jgi:hypothetical protein
MAVERLRCTQFGKFDKKNRRFHSQYVISLFLSRIATNLNVSICSNFSR